jgi:hypothetical protein
VVTGDGGLIAAANPRLVLVDCGTFDLDAKERLRSALAAAGMAMLDCTISGAGPQARTRPRRLHEQALAFIARIDMRHGAGLFREGFVVTLGFASKLCGGHPHLRRASVMKETVS